MSLDDRRLTSDLERQNGALHATDHADETAPLSPSPNAGDSQESDEVAPVVPEHTGTRKQAGALREIVETVVLALIIFFAVRLVVLNFKVDGESMMPNLQNSEMLLVNRNAYFHFDKNSLLDVIPFVDTNGTDEVYLFNKPQRGDIIVFNPPTIDGPITHSVVTSKPFIKRIIGLPGDHVTFQNGYVYINGKQLHEPYIDGPITNCPARYCDVTVQPGYVFVLGDNRTNSEDSRYFGQVKVSRIIGKAWFTYWPFHDLGGVPHYSYPDLKSQ